MPDEPSVSQEELAERLVETLDRIKAGEFGDLALIQEALDLNAELAPTYTALWGAVPEITTSYPAYVWWPRARNQAAQALAAARSKHYEAAPAPTRNTDSGGSPKVFIVHGHEHGLKEAVARLVTKLGYQPVILHELPNKGRTIIEKIVEESRDAAFAIVLMTADDEGRAAVTSSGGPGALRSRARQNVILELGYFVGVLGRGGVVALNAAPDVLELPSDVSGVLDVQVKSVQDPAWRSEVAREMMAAGLEVNPDDAA